MYIYNIREDIAYSLEVSYLELDSDVKHKARDIILYAECERLRLVNLGTIAL